ncbi:MAG: hypothetical protein QOH34_181, partial [Mycobacterium sp.]|nr:hypothetical protein [Mycobacterium sp.]
MSADERSAPPEASESGATADAPPPT